MDEIQRLLQERDRVEGEIQSDNLKYGLNKAKANLFFDNNAMIEYIASQKFPNDPTAVARFSLVDGDVVYKDVDGVTKKYLEAGEDIGWFEKSVIPNIVPATTFAADVIGATAGAKAGFNVGLRATSVIPPQLLATKLGAVAKAAGVAIPTMIGGFVGNFLVGGGARAGRAGLIDAFYNLPPEEIAAAYKDLLVSSGFSAIPFGAGPTRNVVNKFIGKEDALRELMNLRANTQKIIDEAAEKFGVVLTPAEASDIGTKSLGIQFFLSQQPQIVSVRNFYKNRSAKIRDAVETLAEKFGSLRGQFGDVNTRIAAASKQALKELADKRKARATKLYDSIRENPEPVLVDTTPIIKKIDSELANKELDDDVVEALTSFKSQLFDRDGNQIQNMMSLHDRRAGSIENLIKANLGTQQGNKLIGLREDLTTLFDVADPTYNLARRVYDPTKPHLDNVARSAIGKLSKLMTDKQSAKAVQNLFDPNVSVQSVRNAKRILKAIDAEAFKDAKKFFITDKLDDVFRQSIDQGVPQFQQFFVKPKTDRLLKEILEPEEYNNFSKLLEIIGKASKAPRGASQTQPFTAIEKQLADDVKGLGQKSAGIALAAIRVPGRFLTGTLGDDIVHRIAIKQKESYYNALADALFDPNATENIKKAYDYLSPLEFMAKQTGVRAIREGVDAITPDEEYRATSGQTDKIAEQILGGTGATQSFDDENIFEDQRDELIMQGLENLTVPRTPGMTNTSSINPATSPTILPSEIDREIAMRMQMQDNKGIAGLG